jgi:uncharacterized caspase-like protein
MFRVWMPRILWVALAAACTVHAADLPAGKTWVLSVGISKYEKLPHDLWLQYPDSDAETFARFLASPRGGAVPADQMLVLTNEQATTAGLRNAFRTFLKDRPGKNDTVFILIAGHGTVDERGAYILTYDSDPRNLSGSAIPMADLHTLVEEELTKVARVVLLADVCRAATIAGQKTASLGAVVEKIGEVPGEMLGLMAARPKELSLEGPEFGGGHGAFTYAVLKGLSGAADTDRDGVVTAGELIDFVSADVSKLTGNRQHPRDFGNMENSTQLSDLSKPGIPIP